MCRDSSVVTVTQAPQNVSHFRQGKMLFFSSASTQSDSVDNTGYVSVDNEDFVPGIKRPKSDNQHSFPSGVWVKNAWS